MTNFLSKQMTQALALANQAIYLHLHTPLYGGQYYVGQYISFPTLASAEQFLQAAPECVTLGAVRYQFPYSIYDVYASNGCYVPNPIPAPIPPPYCPCANNGPILY